MMSRREKSIFLILVLAFLTLRLCILFTLPSLEHSNKLDKEDNNELHKGVIAKELIEGKKWPLLDYQTENHQGGSIVIGLLTVPFFLVFGESIYTLKLVALLLSLSTFVCWCIFAYRYFGGNIAVLNAIFLIFPPPIFTIYSLVNKGEHYQSGLFTILALLIFYKILYQTDPNVSVSKDFKKSPYFYFILLGLLSGLGLYFAYIFIVTIITILVIFFILDKRFFIKREFFAFFVSFFIGFIPWIAYGMQHKFINLYYENTSFWSHFHINGFFARLFLALTDWFKASFGFTNLGFLNAKLFSSFYLYLFFISFLYLVVCNRANISNFFASIKLFRKSSSIYNSSISKEIPILIYILIFFIVFSASDFYLVVSENRFKFFFPLFPFIAIALAIFFARLFNYKGFFAKKFVFVWKITLFLALIMCFMENTNLISPKDFAKLPKYYKAYSYELLGSHTSRFGVSHRIEMINMLSSKEKKIFAFKGLAESLPDDFLNRFDYYDNLFRYMVDKEYKPYLYRHMMTRIDIKLDPLEIANFINKVDKDFRKYCYEGIGIVLGSRKDFGLLKDFSERTDEKYASYLYRGFGAGFLTFSWIYALPPDFNYRFNNRQLRDIFNGYGELFGFFENGSPQEARDFLSLTIYYIPSEYREDFYTGLGRGMVERYGYNLDKCIKAIDKIDRLANKCNLYKGLGQGMAMSYGNNLSHENTLKNNIINDYQACYLDGFQEKLLNQ